MGSLRVRVVAVIVAVILLNVVGMLRYPGGPLRSSVIDDPLWLDLTPAGEGWSVGSSPSTWSAIGKAIYLGADELTNPLPWAAAIEAITPLNVTGGLVIDRILVGTPESASAGLIGIGPEPVLPEGRTIEELYSPVPVTVGPGTSADVHPIMLVVHGDRPGAAGFTGLAIDYRVGPFTFRVVQHMGLALCLGPLPAGQECPSP